MNHVNHISLSEDSRHTYSLLVTTFSDAGHSTSVISFPDEDTAEAVHKEMSTRGGHRSSRLYKKKESPNESIIS